MLRVVLAVVAWMLPACTAAPTAPPQSAVGAPLAISAGYTPYLTAWPCPFHAAESETEGQTFRCGHMSVPEDRAQPYGPKVVIAYAVFNRHTQPPSLDAVLMLRDAPGVSALEWAPQRMHALASLRASHDVVLFDPRGTGFSTRLGCEQWFGRSDNPYAVCAADMRSQGRDPAQYGSNEIAADAIDLISALSYARASLHGTDFGVKLAERIVQRAPSRVRSVVNGGLNSDATMDGTEVAPVLATDVLLTALLDELWADQSQKADAWRTEWAAMAESALGKKELFGYIDTRFSDEDGARLRRLADRLNGHELTRLYSPYVGGDVFGGGITPSGMVLTRCNDGDVAAGESLAIASAADAPGTSFDAACEQLGVSTSPLQPRPVSTASIPTLMIVGEGDASLVEAAPGRVVVSLPPMGIQADRAACAQALAQVFTADPTAPLVTPAACDSARITAPTAQLPLLDLAGTAWQVQSFGVPMVAWAALGEAPIQLRFGTDGRVTATAGCNAIGARYAVKGGALRLDEMASLPAPTDTACAPAVALQERRLVRALPSLHAFHIQDDALTIQYNAGRGVIHAVRVHEP